jgi:hypothetical protein
MRKKFEIWIGNYHLGQGYGSSTEPELLAIIEASTFEIACLIYELDSKLKWLIGADAKGTRINANDIEWSYHARGNYNSWTGKYYSSKEEALKSFNSNL